MAIHAVASGCRSVAHATGQIQKDPRMQNQSLFLTAGTPYTLQPLLIFGGKNQHLTLRFEWHEPFLHENVL